MKSAKGRGKGWHPSVVAALIGAGATITAAVFTTILLKKPDPAKPEGQNSGGTSVNNNATAPVKLAKEYTLAKGDEYIQLLFTLDNWNLASRGAWEGSMNGTYRQDGNKVTLIIASSRGSAASLSGPLQLTLDSYGVIHFDPGQGVPEWSLAKSH